jgi:hypothetical protein
MPGGRLTSQDRQHIAAGLAEGLGYAEIGRRLDRPASTIMREVTRNGGPGGYGADQAHEAAKQRARRRKLAQPPAPPAPGDGHGDSHSDGHGDGHGRDPQAVQDFAGSFTTILVQSGLPRMAARVLTCLYITDSGTLTAAELVQWLRVSPASVSHAVTLLDQLGLLNREHAPGERRERYAIDDELWLRTLLVTVQVNDAHAAASQRGAEILGVTTPAGARFELATELLHLVNESLRQAMEQWRQHLATRNAGRQR